MADVAQSVRAPACGAGGRGFETHHSPQEVYTKNTILVFFSLLCLMHVNR